MIYSIFTIQIIIMLFLSYLSIFIKNKYFTFFIIMIFLILFSMFYGFREIVIYNQDGATTDTYRYALIWFNEIHSLKDIFYGSSSWKADYIFFTIPYLVNMISHNPNIYLFVNSFISFGILFIAYYKIINGKKYYYYFPLILLLLLSTSTLVANYGNLLRQGLAISLILLSISYMTERKRKIGYFILLLAIFSHKSSLIFIPIYILVFHYSMKVKSYILILFLSLPFTFFNIFIFLNNNIMLISEKLNTYQDSSSRMLLYKSITLFFLAILIYIYYKNKKTDLIFDKLFKIFLLLISFSFLFFKIEIISGRLLFYPSILLPFFIFYNIHYLKQKEFYFFLLTISSVVYAYFILTASSTYRTIRFINTIF